MMCGASLRRAASGGGDREIGGALAPLGGLVAVLLNPNQVIGFANDESLAVPLALLKGV